uniref:Uncharacterized protein n=1 Tax=Opuntia streptacantha TaxID=393608 RepID=A0A7C9A1B0_OPUST
MSSAAWGRVISSQSGVQVKGPEKGDSSCERLHVCNYELGVIFVFPPPGTEGSHANDPSSLDDVDLPFIMPAPKYGPRDRPATMRAMREALAELAEQEERMERAQLDAAVEMMEEVPGEEDEDEVVVEAGNGVPLDEEEEKAYADVLWSQVESSQSC